MLALDTVYNMKAEELLAALPDSTIDLIVTSPPYDNLRTYKGFEWDFELIARESYRVLKPGGVLVWVVGDATIDGSETMVSFEQAIYFRRDCGFNLWDTMIWQKPKGSNPSHIHNPTRYQACFEYMFVFSKGKPKTHNLQMEANTGAGSKGKSAQRQRNGVIMDYSGNYVVSTHSPFGNVWNIQVGWNHTTKDKIAFEHPAMFPEELAERHILTWSNPDDTVLDYFGGSGTTAKMARQNGRRYLTCDISAEYVELMQKRLAQPFTVPMFAEQPIEQPKPTQNGLFDAIEGDKE